MKQKILALVALFLAVQVQTTVLAQNDKAKKGDKKEARLNMTPEQRITSQTQYVARELLLDDQTTVKFTTLYTKYLTDIEACRRQHMTVCPDMTEGNKTQLTDEQIEKRLEARFAHAHQILNIREKYYREFKNILTIRQIQKMYRAEKNIHKKVRREVERRQRNPNAKRNR